VELAGFRHIIELSCSSWTPSV